MKMIIILIPIALLFKQPIIAWTLKKLYPNMTLSELIEYEKATKYNLSALILYLLKNNQDKT